VDHVGPNDFLSVKQISEATTKYLRNIQWRTASVSRIFLDPTAHQFHWLASTGQSTAIQDLQTDGSWLNLYQVARDRNYRSPLSCAAENGFVAVVRLLVDDEKNIDCRDTGLRTPLSYAAGNGHLGVVKALLENGAYVETWDRTGRTPLSYAAGNGHIEVVEVLLNGGANPKAMDDSGQTPLSRAQGKNVLASLRAV